MTYRDPDDAALVQRLTVDDLYALKLKTLKNIAGISMLHAQIRDDLEQIDAYFPGSIEYRFDNHSDNPSEKCVDRMIWRHLIRLFFLEKYMLCTEYERMTKEINEFQTPQFTSENAWAWLDGLKSLIYENVRLMCKRVYQDLITQWYYTGSGYQAPKKKRNNNGVDKWFIIHTGDHGRIFQYWANHPTITDDLEKVCFILDGKQPPANTLIARAKAEKVEELENEYFSVRFCKNGNTHYRMTDETQDKLNRIGPDGNVIGEKIRIKILERGWGV